MQVYFFGFGCGRAATGTVLQSGEALQKALTQGPLASGCRVARAGETEVLLLPGGRARALAFRQIPWEGGELTALLAADLTKAWAKTQELAVCAVRSGLTIPEIVSQ